MVFSARSWVSLLVTGLAAAYIFHEHAYILSGLELLNKYAGLGAWLAGTGAFMAAIAALFGEKMRKHFSRPILVVDKEPRVEPQSFPFSAEDCNFNNGCTEVEEVEISFYGKNHLLKVTNGGNTIASEVVARVERVIDVNRDKIEVYHPTRLKWSGEPYEQPVDIYPGTYFYLDLIKTIDFDKPDQPSVPRSITIHDKHWYLWIYDPVHRGLSDHRECAGKWIVEIHIGHATGKPVRKKITVEFLDDPLRPRITLSDLP